RQSQVAVMDLAEHVSGDYRVITEQTDRGEAGCPAWSADGTRLYYFRAQDTPLGIYDVAVHGQHQARAALIPGVMAPAPLADGSLLFLRREPAGVTEWRIYRRWFDRDEEEPVGGAIQLYWSVLGTYPTLRVSWDGREVIFRGSPRDSS